MTPRYRVAWSISNDVLVNEGTPEEHATSICSCIIEQWSEDDEDWTTAEDERAHKAYARLREDDNWEDSAPYEEAKARLLSRAGLTENDLTDPDNECW